VGHPGRTGTWIDPHVGSRLAQRGLPSRGAKAGIPRGIEAHLRNLDLIVVAIGGFEGALATLCRYAGPPG
jgi:hypothetical protein